MENIRVIVKKPFQTLTTTSIENSLENLDPNVACVTNGKITDILHGNIIFVGTIETDEGLENASLTNEQIEYIKKDFLSEHFKYWLPLMNKEIEVAEI